MIPIDCLENYKAENIISLDQAKLVIFQLKVLGKKVGLCHGCFDLLHPGHIKHFESAKKLCDVLFVSLTADEFVSKKKGSNRPVFSEQLRAYAVANLKFVDYVIISNEATGMQVINSLKPSVYIKGPDIKSLDNPIINAEREAVKLFGGRTEYTTDKKLSTTEIIDYIKQSHS